MATSDCLSSSLRYHRFTTQQINQSPELQWQINTVTDPYGDRPAFKSCFRRPLRGFRGAGE
jgi:hypothetical protein